MEILLILLGKSIKCVWLITLCFTPYVKDCRVAHALTSQVLQAHLYKRLCAIDIPSAMDSIQLSHTSRAHSGMHIPVLQYHAQLTPCRSETVSLLRKPSHLLFSQHGKGLGSGGVEIDVGQRELF